MIVVGLTGKACSGKNQIAKVFEKKGFLIIDVDKLGHVALEDKKDKIVEEFGKEIIVDDKIDRRILGNIVFSSKEKLKLLESIVHPYIKQLCIKMINESDKNVIINAAILQRGKLLELCSNVIFVKASFFIRYKRSKIRDKRNLIWFIKRELAQKDININNIQNLKKVYQIFNQSSEKEIYRQVDKYCDIFINNK